MFLNVPLCPFVSARLAGEADRVKREASSGFTLIELSIALLVSGILMAAYIDASRLWLENRSPSVPRWSA